MENTSSEPENKNDKLNVFNIDSPIGGIQITDNGLGITSLKFLKSEVFNNGGEIPSPIAEKAIKQLDEYFNGKRKAFDLPLSIEGTNFQKTVWEELLKIPYGETLSYKDIAVRIGNPKAARAIGGANNKNRIPIIIPCHRVIGKNGALVGYSNGPEIKEFLLNLESKYIK